MPVELEVTQTKTRKRIAVFVFQTLFFVTTAIIVYVTIEMIIVSNGLEGGDALGLLVLLPMIVIGLLASIPSCALSVIFGGFAVVSTNKAIKFFAIVFEVISVLYLLALIILALTQGNAA